MNAPAHSLPLLPSQYSTLLWPGGTNVLALYTSLLAPLFSPQSAIARAFAHALGYETELFSLFKDMTARDLLQRRATDHAGNTTWEHSPLVTAALHGRLAILDGLHRMPTDTVSDRALGPGVRACLVPSKRPCRALTQCCTCHTADIRPPAAAARL